ncbi:MAG: VCBS repeat-containing protein, partial [Thermoplasmata archaeon]|nr:VCBS repeat-containing protein [Thermoplasmata archaeon]
KVIIEDLDADGNLDVLLSYEDGTDRMPVFMGSSSGVDTTPDFYLDVGTNSVPFGVTAGDLNADGYMEVILMTTDNFNHKLYVYEGSSTGYDGNSPHKISIGGYCYAMEVADINVDGYGDLVIGYTNNMRVYYGGDSLPTGPDITKDGPNSPYSLVVATGGKASTRKFAGRIVTEQINKPAGKVWDTLVLEGTIPKNSSFRITVQDSTGRAMAGFEDRTDVNIDLQGLTSPAIKVDLWLESDLNTSTPVIDLLRVKWQDKDTWREQFFGNAKVDRTMGTIVEDGRLNVLAGGISTPDMLFAGMLAEEDGTPTSYAFDDEGDSDPVAFQVRAASAAATADVNGDGYTDIVFASYRSSGSTYSSSSPLYLGSSVGWRNIPAHIFSTVGATDVL